MSEFYIYPAIDLRDGSVVRLMQGKVDRQTTYAHQPGLVAQDWIDQGAAWLHIVNLDGAFGKNTKKNAAAITNILETVGEKVSIQLSGGIRTIGQVKSVLNLGVERVVLGTAVIENPAFGKHVLEEFGGERIAFGFDVLGTELMSRGWQQHSGVDMFTLADDLKKAGAQTLIYTNIKRDGMQTGVDWENAQMLAEKTGLKIIASGGTASLEDIRQVRNAALAGVIIGRALYEKNFTLKAAIDVC